MIAHILALHSNPSENVRINGHLSNALTISNGTIGPPWFMFLPWNKLRLNPDIKGLRIRDRAFKVAAFADDILLSLRSPHITLPNLLKDIHHFGTLSNLKITYTKSHALNVSLTRQEVESCESSFPFIWKRDTITYLGTQITTKLSDLYKCNFHVALNKAKLDLKNWAGFNVLWFGRSVWLKWWFSHAFYTWDLQTILIRLPAFFLVTYRWTCSMLIWRNCPLRIKYTQLTRTKTKGEIGSPNLHKYYLACHLTRIVDWNIGDYPRIYAQGFPECSHSGKQLQNWNPMV